MSGAVQQVPHFRQSMIFQFDVCYEYLIGNVDFLQGQGDQGIARLK